MAVDLPKGKVSGHLVFMSLVILFHATAQRMRDGATSSVARKDAKEKMVDSTSY